MDFTYDDEQDALRDAVRGLLGKGPGRPKKTTYPLLPNASCFAVQNRISHFA